jgi:hypothetical protein
MAAGITPLLLRGCKGIILSRGVVMEDSKCRNRPPLTVRREFASCRLEDEVLVRAYELATPVLRSSSGAIRLTCAGERPAKREYQFPLMCKGA